MRLEVIAVVEKHLKERLQKLPGPEKALGA
jgi:hypothetical protein